MAGFPRDYRDIWKDTDTQGRNTYLVACCCGGVMEDPDIHYEDYQIIRADSRREAEDKYNKLNKCSYYYGSVVDVLYENKNLVKDERGRTLEFIDQRQRPFDDPMTADIARELAMLGLIDGHYCAGEYDSIPVV